MAPKAIWVLMANDPNWVPTWEDVFLRRSDAREAMRFEKQTSPALKFYLKKYIPS